MSGPDTRPTPANGIPVINPEEITAPKSAADERTDRLLAAIKVVRDEARDRETRTDARLSHLEIKLEEVSGKTDTNTRLIGEVSGKTDANTRLIGEQAEAITRVASAAAKAADLALEAKQQVARLPDETTKLVESGWRIHGAAIAVTVDAAVKKAVEPLSEKVGVLEQNDEKRATTLTQQNETLAKQDEQLALTVSLLSQIASWRKHWAFRIALVVGGILAGWFAARGH